MVNLRNWWRRVISGLTDRKRRDGGESEGTPRRPRGAPFAPEARQLIAALKHANPDVRAGAAWQLGRLAAETSSTAPVASTVRTEERARAVVDALVDALGDADAGVRSAAALSLGEWGAAAVGAIPALIEALAEWDDDVRSSAGIALQDIGIASRGPLQDALAHADPRVRAEAEAILTLMPED